MIIVSIGDLYFYTFICSVRKLNPRVPLSAIFVVVIMFVSPSDSAGQKKNDNYRINLRKTEMAIRVDGIIDSAWLKAEVATNFYMVLPMDTSAARVRTDVRMTYDGTNLYLLAVCFHAVPGPYFVESLRRDFVFGKNDNFLLFMDPFDDQTNGFSFGANAAGAQWDGIMYEGGKVDLSWDNKWASEVKNYDDKWILEMAIPFKTIRYKKGITRWGINFSRLDLKTTEKSSWAPVPRQFPTASLAYTGTLVWDEPPPQPGPNVSLIPYAVFGANKDHLTDQGVDYRLPRVDMDLKNFSRLTAENIGADAKIAVSSTLNLDLTFFPDFSQVEVDRQVTNLDRFELFFPERRQFFLENADLFANFGYAGIRPFFSRRIGLGVPIQFGARLSGKLNKDWRIGAMDMQTEKVDAIGLPSQNFAVVALQRRVFARSNVAAIFVNKKSLNYDPTTEESPYSEYNRNFGLEYNLASSNNLWTGKALLLRSFSPADNGHNLAHAANLQYASREWTLAWQHEYVGRDYNAEAGYVPRNGYIRLNPFASRLFFPKGTKILSHGPRIFSTYYFNEQGTTRTDNETILLYLWTFRTQSVFALWTGNAYVKLLKPFDPTNSGDTVLAEGTTHNWYAYGMDYFSKPQQLFTYSLSARYGGYYANGTRLNVTSELGYRFQPFVSLLLSSTYNQIDLPQPWGKKTFWLIGPRVDITMTNKLFFTAFAQYNEQVKNVNVNTRFQWRYRPASDLFIVYTDNYFADTFLVKNRALVIKLTYWWNI